MQRKHLRLSFREIEWWPRPSVMLPTTFHHPEVPSVTLAALEWLMGGDVCNNGSKCTSPLAAHCQDKNIHCNEESSPVQSCQIVCVFYGPSTGWLIQGCEQNEMALSVLYPPCLPLRSQIASETLIIANHFCPLGASGKYLPRLRCRKEALGSGSRFYVSFPRRWAKKKLRQIWQPRG